MVVCEEQASDSGVHGFVTADELVAEGQSIYETMLLDPEYPQQGVGDEDAFDGGKRNETLGKVERLSDIELRALSAFLLMQGTVSTAPKRCSR